MNLSAILTEREWAVLSKIAIGNASKEAANELGISTKTVDNHIQHIKEKVECQKNTELSVFWFCLKFNISIDEVKRRAISTFFFLIMCFQITCISEVMIRPRLRNEIREEASARRGNEDLFKLS
jgi:DNA-binding CsgD family transcriptional regulator